MIVPVQISRTRPDSSTAAPTEPTEEDVWLVAARSPMPIRASTPATQTKVTKRVPRLASPAGQVQLMPWLDRGIPHQLQRSRLDSWPGEPGDRWNCGPIRTPVSIPLDDLGPGGESGSRDH